MKAFSDAIHGVFGYKPLPETQPLPGSTSTDTDAPPALVEVSGTEPPAAAQPHADAVAQAVAGLNQPARAWPSLSCPAPPTLNLSQLPKGVVGGLATAFTGGTTMATVLVKQGVLPVGTVIMMTAAAAFGGFVTGGFLEFAYRESAADQAAQRQA